MEDYHQNLAHCKSYSFSMKDNPSFTFFLSYSYPYENLIQLKMTKLINQLNELKEI